MQSRNEAIIRASRARTNENSLCFMERRLESTSSPSPSYLRPRERAPSPEKIMAHPLYGGKQKITATGKKGHSTAPKRARGIPPRERGEGRRLNGNLVRDKLIYAPRIPRPITGREMNETCASFSRFPFGNVAHPR